MKEHNKTYYSLEELKRVRDCYEGYQDGEEVYYFVGTLRYACDEIKRLNKENTILRQNSQYLVKQKDELEEVINNAIEYLTDEGVCILNKGMKENERLVWTWENYYDLLDILKGVDKECK